MSRVMSNSVPSKWSRMKLIRSRTVSLRSGLIHSTLIRGAFSDSSSRSKVDVVFKEISEDRIEVNHDEQQILTVGQPEAEETEEALFSEAFNPESDNVKDIVGSADPE